MGMNDSDQTFRHYIEYFLHYVSESTGFVTDDSQWSKKALVSAIKDGRSSIIYQAGKDPSSFSPSMFQTLQCVNMKVADRQECPCAPASGCTWLVSEGPIPTPILIQSVTDTMGMKRFDKIAWADGSQIPNRRLVAARTAPYYTLREKEDGLYLYIWNDSFTPVITFTAIFEDPILANCYPSCGVIDETKKCFPLDAPICLDKRFKDFLFRSMVGSLAPIKLQAPTDVINNDTPQ